MKVQRGYHHFKGNRLSRSEYIQRLVTRELLKSRVPDNKRDSSITWELKHSSSVVQIARILALKRGLKVEYAEIIAALHDIGVIKTGKYQEHARRGMKIAKSILRKTGRFTDKEIALITNAIGSHSDKHIYSDEPYTELIKDADVFDCSLYEGVDQEYIRTKTPEKLKEYFRRLRRIRKELGLPGKKLYEQYR